MRVPGIHGVGMDGPGPVGEGRNKAEVLHDVLVAKRARHTRGSAATRLEWD
jgi:hypothetical protein